MLVAGAVTGGGLTVIANAPNPAGYAILKGFFDDEHISPCGCWLPRQGRLWWQSSASGRFRPDSAGGLLR